MIKLPTSPTVTWLLMVLKPDTRQECLYGCSVSFTNSLNRFFPERARNGHIYRPGHSDYQAMKPYIEIAEKTRADAMKLFETELEKYAAHVKVDTEG